MKNTTYILSTLLLAAAMHAATTPAVAQEGYSNMEFVENKGQWDPAVQYRGAMEAGAFFLQPQGFTVLLNNEDDLRRITGAAHGVHPSGAGNAKNAGNVQGAGSVKGPGGQGSGSGAGGQGAGSVGAAGPDILHSHAYRVIFEGADEKAQVRPEKPVGAYENYYIGNDPSKWAARCNMYQAVLYRDIYPNIDLRYYSDRGRLKFDLIVRPGGDPAKIVMRYEGADKLSVKGGQLVVGTSVGNVKELSPYSYQAGVEGRTQVSCKYVVSGGNTVRFKLGNYSTDTTLVIDPVLVFSSFTGSKSSNWGFTATYGPDGSFYAGGIVFGNGYPVSTGAIEAGFRGGSFDVGIMKFSSNGSKRLYATYLGGYDNETPHSMICDPNGNLVVLGRTYSIHGQSASQDFPFLTDLSQGGGGDVDMFVARLNGDGTKLLGSMRIGGSAQDCVNTEDQVRSGSEKAQGLIRNYGDDSRSEVILDGSNNIYVAASTRSSDFPGTAGSFQPALSGNQDGVVLKINPACNGLLWASYLGGTGDDAAFVLKVNPANGDLYVAGATSSTDFPGDKSRALQAANGGGICDGFLTIISNDGKQQKQMTYLGTALADAVYGVQLDKKGFPYVMGTTNGSWPHINADYYMRDTKQFVAKLQPDLSAYIFSTVFGSGSGVPGNPNISPVAFLVDRCENLYISGWGGWIINGTDPYGLSGTLGMPHTSDALKPDTDGRDFYFIVIKKNASDILYGTFFGQTDNAQSISEHVDGGTSRYDQNGVIYQAICANCNGRATKPFKTSPGVWAPSNGTGTNGCNEAALKIAFNFAGVSAGLRVDVNGHAYDTSGCIPLDATFRDTVRSARSYIWSFGDGTPDLYTTDYQVEHTYNTVGVYQVRLIAIDSNTCNVADTVYSHIIARNDKAPLAWDFLKTGNCQSLDYVFMNHSTAPPGKPFSDDSFLWDFGDGQQAPSGPADVTHSFLSVGTYIVKLILVDTNYCNYPDTLARTVRVSPIVRAQISTPSTGCAPYNAVFTNTSLGGMEFIWDFGDGSAPVNTIANPTHLYANPGTYSIHLTAIDPMTCNKQHDTTISILVSGKPHAEFSFDPSPPVANTRTIFTNLSTGAERFQWIFGDGSSEVKTTMDTAIHQYEQTGNFQACLVAYNQYHCTDTACHPVAAIINPLMDVPNAFTPGRFGQNSIVRVEGFGITRLLFRIYNRYGQVVFESSDHNDGWDGRFKGVDQPMGVYAYTVEADFYDGTHATKKGDITLIR